ncbi:hypothetical protein FACS189447_03470 [Spirochaetia bacterium]|nr:hypothetical protein FACS189447_03470 [Spirochaetia bacterium]
MVGISTNLSTKTDWVNTYQYVIKQGDQGLREQLKKRLLTLRDSGKMLVLKKDVKKSSEELTPEDFEEQPDPGSVLVRSGLSLSEIDEMVSKLTKGV